MDLIRAALSEPAYRADSFMTVALRAAIAFLFVNRGQVAPVHRAAAPIFGLVTSIPLCHHIRIPVSWSEPFQDVNGQLSATGMAFRDAYRYVDWLLLRGRVSAAC